MAPRRSAALDGVRAFAMLAIVAGHLWGAGFDRPLVYSWHVPVFFFLSGYLWKPGRTFRSELRGRVLTLAVPYVLWIAVIQLTAVPALTARGLGTPDWWDLLRGGTGPPTPYWAVWFVSALFFSALWMRLLEHVPLPVRWAVALVATVLVAYVAPGPLGDLPLSLGQSAVGLLLMLAGDAFARLRRRVELRWWWGAVAVVAGLTVADVTRGSVDLKPLDLGIPVLGLLVALVVSAGLVLVSERLFRAAPAAVDAVVSRLGQATLVVLFVHLPIGYLLGVSGDARSAAGAALTAALSWALGLVLLALPRTWPLTGVGAPVKPRTRGALRRPSAGGAG